MDTASITNDRPASYECTLCGKTHRLSQQSRTMGTDKYSIHWNWRVGGPDAIVRTVAK